MTANNHEFLPKDPAKALKAVTDDLYTRLTLQRAYAALGLCDAYEQREVEESIHWLETLIDKIERSL